MVDIFEIIPIENKGMSVITAIILAFLIIGFIYYMFTINKKFDDYDKLFASNQIDINEMKTNTALLVQSTRNIESMFEKHTTKIERIIEQFNDHLKERRTKQP